MDFKTKFRFDIPEALIEALGINDDTVFIVSYENGSISVEPLTDEENTEAIEEPLFRYRKRDYAKRLSLFRNQIHRAR